MPPKSPFNRLDAFTKTVEDARVRTTSGGIVTIASLLLITYLIWGEWVDYRRVNVQPLLVVDKARGDKMEIHMNVSFPRMPCELLSLDVMDVSGAVQSGVIAGITKTRLKPESEGGGAISSTQLQLNSNEDKPKDDPNYCGSCYSADPPPNAKKPGCCQTCEEVRQAYAAKSWAFGSGQNVEQCERAHYAQHLDEQRREGCRIEGGVRVNKVAGNFHFAPGPAVDGQGMHMHDIKLFMDSPEPHTFTHYIHQLRFGPVLPDHVVKKLAAKDQMSWSNHHINPLDASEQATDEKHFNFMYFVKVVPTAYLPLGWDKDAGNAWSGTHGDVPHDLIELGQYGYGASGSVETHQYSVTSHRRHLMGGEAKEEGHSERIHLQGGLPGVWFNYEISPMKVINREQRNKSFSAFLFGVCAVIGGTLTVAAAIDRALYEGTQQINKVKDR